MQGNEPLGPPFCVYEWISKGIAVEGDGTHLDGARLAAAIRENESRRVSTNGSCNLPPNIDLTGFVVDSEIDLGGIGNAGAEPQFFRFNNCTFIEPILFDDASIRTLEMNGCSAVAIIARDSRSRRVVFNGLTNHDKRGVIIQFQSARIAGSFFVREGRLRYTKEQDKRLESKTWGTRITGAALDLADSQIDGDVAIEGIERESQSEFDGPESDGYLRCEGRILLSNARIGGELTIGYVRIAGNDSGKYGVIDANACEVGHGFNLTRVLTQDAVMLQYASIGANLTVSQSCISTQRGGTAAVLAPNMHVKGQILFDRSVIDGKVSLNNVKLEDSLQFLDCAVFVKPEQSINPNEKRDDVAISAMDARIDGNVNFRWIDENGSTNSFKAREEWKNQFGISGDATPWDIKNNPPVGIARGPYVAGQVNFARAHIEGDFEIDGLYLNLPKPIPGHNLVQSPVMLTLEGATVAGQLVFRELFSGANIEIELSNATAHILCDDLSKGWGPRRHIENELAHSIKIRIDGFVYDQIKPIDTQRIEHRLDWLKLQEKSNFQSFYQVARVSNASGNEKDSRRVLVEGFDNEGSQLGWSMYRPLRYMYGLAFGYAYNPTRAFVALLLYYLSGVGAVMLGMQAEMFVVDTTSTVSLSRGADSTREESRVVMDQPLTLAGKKILSGSVAASAPKTGASAVNNATGSKTAVKKDTPGGPEQLRRIPIVSSVEGANPEFKVCTEIDAWTYAADVMVPLLDLRQKEHCTVTPAATEKNRANWLAVPWAWRIGMALYATFGAVVTSLALLTFSGILRRDVR